MHADANTVNVVQLQSWGKAGGLMFGGGLFGDRVERFDRRRAADDLAMVIIGMI
jgi:hypothetical protein